jgi:Ser/Thr protein kinase RdoA (MazF antagonist)
MPADLGVRPAATKSRPAGRAPGAGGAPGAADVRGVPAPIAAALTRLQGDHGRYFPGATRVPAVSVLRVQRRRLSDVAEVELALGTSTVRIYVKHHRKAAADIERVREKAGLEFRMLGILQDRFRDVSGCAVARPIAFFPDLITVVTEAVEGANLHHLIKRQAAVWRPLADVEALRGHCRAAGAWLRRFQDATATGETASPPAGFILQHLRGDLEQCVGLGFADGLARELLAFVEDRLGRVARRAYPVVGQHPDFQPDNVLVAPGRVTGLDFTSFRHGSPYSDVARFVVSVEFFAKSPLYRRARMRGLAAAFLGGYGWRGGEDDTALLPHAVLHIVRAARMASAWPGPMRRLVAAGVIRFLTAWTREMLHRGEAWVPAEESARR